MNIFLRELRANLKSLIIWCVIVVLFVVVGYTKFSAYYNNPDMLSLLDSMPPAMVAALSLKAFNLTTVAGFFGIMFAYFALMMSIASGMWGSDIISKEERDKTVEFSLTLPVTRQKLITAKTLAAVVNSALLLLVSWAFTLLMAQKYEPDSVFYKFSALGMLAIFILQMVFLAVGIFLGCAMKQFRRAGSLTVSVLLVTYFLSIIVAMNKHLDFLKYLSPFTYFEPVKLLNDSRLQVGYVLLCVAIVAACLAGAYTTYTRRDLYI
jgi:beta-exotoxin I transport system permease protein